jgi:diguanylate cyclase (GGDEF)-like protein
MEGARAFETLPGDEKHRESERLAALERLDLMDTPRDEGLERVVRLIKEIYAIDIGIVSLIDAHRQWYKACSGLVAGEVPREDTFCRYVVDYGEPVVAQDATKDPRFCDNPAVTGETHIRFYAGVPLKTKSGYTIGTVCAIDRKPRSFGPRELVILQELAGLAMDRIELLHSAASDGLTDALTRRAFREEADRLVSAARRQSSDLSCVVLDVDHFKAVNDNLGHAAGDFVLKAVAETCKTILRSADLFGRLGGEEFAILLPHTDLEGAIAVAERLRAAIAVKRIDGGHAPLSVTASFGITALSMATNDIETLLAQADSAMYRAKRDGRNCCVSWNTLETNHEMGPRQRVLKAGAIMFNDRRSSVDCTIKSLGTASAGISVSDATDVPAEFLLAIEGDGFEARCEVVASDRQHLEVIFR